MRVQVSLQRLIDRTGAVIALIPDKTFELKAEIYRNTFQNNRKFTLWSLLHQISIVLQVAMVIPLIFPCPNILQVVRTIFQRGKFRRDLNTPVDITPCCRLRSLRVNQGVKGCPNLPIRLPSSSHYISKKLILGRKLPIKVRLHPRQRLQ